MTNPVEAMARAIDLGAWGTFTGAFAQFDQRDRQVLARNAASRALQAFKDNVSEEMLSAAWHSYEFNHTYGHLNIRFPKDLLPGIEAMIDTAMKEETDGTLATIP